MEHRRSCELEQVWNDDELKVVEDILLKEVDKISSSLHDEAQGASSL